MVCASKVQAGQHEALSCLLPPFASILRIYAYEVPEPCWRRLVQKHKPWDNSLLPAHPHVWEQAEILPFRGIGIDAVLAIVHGGFVKPLLKMETPLKVFFPGTESCPPIRCDMQENIQRLPKLQILAV